MTHKDTGILCSFFTSALRLLIQTAALWPVRSAASQQNWIRHFHSLARMSASTCLSVSLFIV